MSTESILKQFKIKDDEAAQRLFEVLNGSVSEIPRPSTDVVRGWEEYYWIQERNPFNLQGDDRMSYLIAKKHNEAGCLAVQVEPDRALAGLVTYLGQRTLDKGIEILTVSDTDTWYEYAPYNVVVSEKEFIVRVLSLGEE